MCQLLVYDFSSFQSHFQFHGVYAGSQQAIPFSLTNHSSAAAHVTFDLSQYADFSLQLPQPSASTHSFTQSRHIALLCAAKEKEPGVSVVEVQANQTVDCSLVFSPTQVRC